MKKLLSFLFFCLCIGANIIQAQHREHAPLSILIEEVDTTMLTKEMIQNVNRNRLKFAQPVFGADCTNDQKSFNQTVVNYARTAVASKAFEELLRRRMAEAYGQCIGDPFYNRDFETQYYQVLAACRAAKSIKINCTGGGGNASTWIGDYNLNKVPEFWWGGWFQGVSACAVQNNCTFAPFPWPYTQAAGIVWHELMHQYGYGHGANNPSENELAKTNCGIPSSNTSWHFQVNTIPYIVGNCVSEILDESQRVCGNILSCPNPNQLKLVDRVGGSTCSCVNDPGKKGLGILEVKNGQFVDVAMHGDGNWIGGWNYNSADNQIVGTGDFNGDGNKDFILYSNWGIGIVSYIAPYWREIVVKPNGTWFGGWNFNSTQNWIVGSGDFNSDGKDDILIQSDWGLGILTLDGRGSLTSLLARPRDTWFGLWRWDATVNTGRDKIQHVADFNGDRKADILVTSSWGTGILTLSGTNTMNAYVAKPNGTWFGGWNFNTRDNWFPGTGDFNGDGKADIVIQSNWGLGILYYDGLSSLNSFMTRPRDTWFGPWRWDATVNTGRDKIHLIDDFNGDRKADILVTSSWGLGILTLNGSTMNAYIAQPNGTRFGGWLFYSTDNQILKSGDFDGNSKKDIVIRSPWGIGVLAVNNENTNLYSLDIRPYGSFLGSWVMENTDKVISTGNFASSTYRDEILLQKSSIIQRSQNISDKVQDESPKIVNSTSAITNLQMAPNPFNDVIRIQYELGKKEKQFVIEVIDVNGQIVNTLFSGVQDAGLYQLEWDGRDTKQANIPNGLYFLRIKTSNEIITKRVVLFKE